MKSKRHLDAELNLIPFIDLLSVCICFLLLTAVWLQVGSLDVKQAIGGQSVDSAVKKPILWAFLGKDGDVLIDVKDSRSLGSLAKTKVSGKDNKPDLEGLAAVVNKIRQKDPLVSTATIQPVAVSVYEDIIDLMDGLKKTGIIDLGVAPL